MRLTLPPSLDVALQIYEDAAQEQEQEDEEHRTSRRSESNAKYISLVVALVAVCIGTVRVPPASSSVLSAPALLLASSAIRTSSDRETRFRGNEGPPDFRSPANTPCRGPNYRPTGCLGHHGEEWL